MKFYWTGANCSTLDLRPARVANGDGHLNSTTSSARVGNLTLKYSAFLYDLYLYQ